MADKNTFTHFRNLDAINKELEEYLSRSWSFKDFMIRADFTSFATGHLVDSGRNGVSTLLRPTTDVIECAGVYLTRGFTQGYIRVLLNARPKVEHGFSTERKYLVVYKNKKGQRESFTVFKTWNDEDAPIENLRALFGYNLPGKTREETDRHYRNVIRLEICDAYSRFRLRNEEHHDELKKTLALFNGAGLKLLDIVEYTHAFGFRIDWVRVKRTSIEFGWYTFETYNSLPCMLKISRVRKIDTVRLDRLGIEIAGYYAHTDQMKVLPEDVPASLKIMRRYKKNKKGA